MYRCRIGCFNSSLQGHNFYSGQTISHDLGPRTKSSIVVILLLYILSNVTIGKTLNSEQVGPQQPTSTLTKFKQFSLATTPTVFVAFLPPSILSSAISPDSRSRTLYTPEIKRSPLSQFGEIINNPHSTHVWLTKKDRNFIAKITYGNRKEKGLKILHWNKGPSSLHRKHQEIETIIQAHKPHVLGLSEANLWNNHDPANSYLTDYELHTCSTANNPNLNVSRVVVYTHSSVIVKRRPDLENNTISSIWLEVGLPHKRKILVCHAKREWRHMNQEDTRSATISAQLERWLMFLDQ